MGYLAFEGPSLERLARSEASYRAAIQSRQLLRVTASPALADASFSMLTFCGLDNRELLPPNLPSQRGQDLVFGQILWRCFVDAVFGHVPFALVHDPAPARKFWPGELTRSAAGIDLCRLTIEAIGLLEFRPEEIAPPDRLQALGRHLVRLAELPGKTLGEILTEGLRESNRRFERAIKARVPQTRTAAHYVDDVAGFFAKLKQSEAREDFWVPLDLWTTDGPAKAEMRARQSLREFGELLYHWPAIVGAARMLRQDGVRVSVPV
jgi:hypothetical protein